jgi:hypothetical protein
MPSIRPLCRRTGLDEAVAHVVGRACPEQLDAPLHPALMGASLDRRPLRAVADQLERSPGPAIRKQRKRLDQVGVTFLWLQARHAEDAIGGPPVQALPGQARDVHTTVDDLDPCVGAAIEQVAAVVRGDRCD